MRDIFAAMVIICMLEIISNPAVSVAGVIKHQSVNRITHNIGI